MTGQRCHLGVMEYARKRTPGRLPGRPALGPVERLFLTLFGPGADMRSACETRTLERPDGLDGGDGGGNPAG
jgi:hypothetical protein